MMTSTKKAGASSVQDHAAEQRILGWLNFVVFLATAAVAYTDWVVVADVSLGYLYVLPIALSALVNPLPLTFGLVAGCTVLQEIFGPSPETLEVRLVRGGIALAGFSIVGFFVTLIVKQRSTLLAEVQRQRDEYERDLMLAAQVQRQVLPRPPRLPNLDLAAAMQTAQLLGGDYYDFYQVSEDVIDVVIADVSGHGAAASLLMPSLAVALRLRARELDGPAAILKDLDQVLNQITNPATFVTMFYGRFHMDTRILRYANGGHNPPLLLHPKTGASQILEGDGPIMGILRDAHYSDVTVELVSGDVLALFTDGVIEQENISGEEFSMERLTQVIAEHATEPASALVASVSNAVSTFAGTAQQADDITLVVLKVL